MAIVYPTSTTCQVPGCILKHGEEQTHFFLLFPELPQKLTGRLTGPLVPLGPFVSNSTEHPAYSSSSSWIRPALCNPTSDPESPKQPSFAPEDVGCPATEADFRFTSGEVGADPAEFRNPETFRRSELANDVAGASVGGRGLDRSGSSKQETNQ